ncbi:MAG: response regulator transcription factor [Acidimicrobiales bacterium]
MTAAAASSSEPLPLRLMIVDNDAAVIELLLLDMGLEGHDVVATAADGEDALRACEETQPDVAVVDVRLGAGIDGLEVARRLRRPGLRVVIHTNYVTPSVVDAAGAAGAVVVEKGSLSALRRAVRG